MYKLISLDLDGTLLDSKGQISKSCMDILKDIKSAGVKLVFNTARPYQIIPESLYDLFSDDYWVLSNGTTILKNDVELYNHGISYYDYTELIDLLPERVSEDFHSIEIGGKIYSSFHCEETKLKWYSNDITFEISEHHLINKILFIPRCGNSFNSLINESQISLPENIKLLVTDDLKYFQFMPKAISKSTAVELILEQEQLVFSDVMCFGNDMNDYDLMISAGRAIAPSNAVKAIREISDRVVESNDNKGVSTYLKNFYFD